MPLELGAMHMSANRSFEVQRTNHFEVIFEGFDEDVFPLAVTSASLPNSSNDPIELPYGNSKVKVAGQATTEDVSLTMKDFITADTEKKLLEWRKKVYDPQTQKVGWAEDYKKNGRVYLFGPDGTVIRTWRLLGCWPTSFESSEFSYDGSDKREITMTISVDNAYIERE